MCRGTSCVLSTRVQCGLFMPCGRSGRMDELSSRYSRYDVTQCESGPRYAIEREGRRMRMVADGKRITKRTGPARPQQHTLAQNDRTAPPLRRFPRRPCLAKKRHRLLFLICVWPRSPLLLILTTAPVPSLRTPPVVPLSAQVRLRARSSMPPPAQRAVSVRSEVVMGGTSAASQHAPTYALRPLSIAVAVATPKMGEVLPRPPTERCRAAAVITRACWGYIARVAFRAFRVRRRHGTAFFSWASRPIHWEAGCRVGVGVREA